MNFPSPSSGPRRARFPQDILHITGLVELCFADVLDYPSRRMLREVRTVARMGPMAWKISRLLGVVRKEEWLSAYVWEEQGRIVANANVTHRGGEEPDWLMSNVAVHPDYRRRGIARSLVEYAVNGLHSRGVGDIYLQVDAANRSAVDIYDNVGFAKIACRMAWQRAGGENRLARPAGARSFQVAERKSAEWMEEYELWRSVSPHGTAWNTPLKKKALRPSMWKGMERMLAGEQEKHFLARRGELVEAALAAVGRASGWEGVLIQREGSGGKVEADLLHAAWDVFSPGQRALLETTPAVSEHTLEKLGFRKRRTFIWMRYTFPGGAP